MHDDQDSAAQPQFDDEQWTYLLRQDALMTQLVKHTATLELLHTYYREITVALHRRPAGVSQAADARPRRDDGAAL